MSNETGDRAVDYVATGIAEDVARRLEGIGGLVVHSGARAEWSDSVRRDYPRIARQFGSRTLLLTNLSRINDSLEVRASLLDTSSAGTRLVATRRFLTGDLRDAESAIAAAVAAALFRPRSPRCRAPPTGLLTASRTG